MRHREAALQVLATIVYERVLTFQQADAPICVISRSVQQVLDGLDPIHVELVQRAIDAGDVRYPEALANSAEPSEIVDLSSQSLYERHSGVRIVHADMDGENYCEH